MRRIESFEDLLNDSSILAGLQDGGSTMSFFRVQYNAVHHVCLQYSSFFLSIYGPKRRGARRTRGSSSFG